jgi:transcriptional regulator with XRE-family HTH domain
MHTGTKIKLLREHHRFSQEFVASELKISQASLSRIESGRVNAKFKYFYSLAKLFGVNPNTLLDD